MTTLIETALELDNYFREYFKDIGIASSLGIKYRTNTASPPEKVVIHINITLTTNSIEKIKKAAKELNAEYIINSAKTWAYIYIPLKVAIAMEKFV